MVFIVDIRASAVCNMYNHIHNAACMIYSTLYTTPLVQPLTYTSPSHTPPWYALFLYTPHTTEHEAWVCPRCTNLRSPVHNPSQAKTTLIICPGSILHQWEAEIQRHTVPGALSVCVRCGVYTLFMCAVWCTFFMCALYVVHVCCVPSSSRGTVHTLPPSLSLSHAPSPPHTPFHPPPKKQVLVYLGQPQNTGGKGTTYCTTITGVGGCLGGLGGGVCGCGVFVDVGCLWMWGVCEYDLSVHAYAYVFVIHHVRMSVRIQIQIQTCTLYHTQHTPLHHHTHTHHHHTAAPRCCEGSPDAEILGCVWAFLSPLFFFGFLREATPKRQRSCRQEMVCKKKRRHTFDKQA